MIELLNDDSGQLFLFEDFDIHRSQRINEWIDKDSFFQDEISLFGKVYLQPRLIRFEGDKGIVYSYSKKSYAAQPWSKVTSELRDKLAKYTDESFNSVLINLYRDGNDSMGLHADNEPELGIDPTIASISYGAERTIWFVSNDNSRRFKVVLNHGSLLLMKGSLQQNWKHEIRKTKKVKSPRINYTFRNVI